MKRLPLFDPPEEILPRSGHTLAKIRETLGDCKRCTLCEGRQNIVFGVGPEKALVALVGEGPGRHEDEFGQPFLGAAGKLLTEVCLEAGLDRRRCYVCNVVKCRPPANREPWPAEVAACRPFLDDQLWAVAPRVVVALGAVAANTLLLTTGVPISRLRGRQLRLRDDRWPVAPHLVAALHPAYILRNPGARGELVEDLKMARRLVGAL